MGLVPASTDLPSRRPRPDGLGIGEAATWLSEAGYPGRFWPTPEGRVHCQTCGADSEPGQVEEHERLRTEGQSDPDDMLILIGVQCPKCHARGSLLLPFGPRANPAEARILLGLRSAAAH